MINNDEYFTRTTCTQHIDWTQPASARIQNAIKNRRIFNIFVNEQCDSDIHLLWISSDASADNSIFLLLQYVPLKRGDTRGQVSNFII